MFIPTNEAVDQARDGSILYMLNDVGGLSFHLFSVFVVSADNIQVTLKDKSADMLFFVLSTKSHKKTKTYSCVSLNLNTLTS